MFAEPKPNPFNLTPQERAEWRQRWHGLHMVARDAGLPGPAEPRPRKMTRAEKKAAKRKRVRTGP